VPAGSQPAAVTKAKTPVRHKVVRGDSLTAIAAHYGVSPKAIQQANKMKSQNVMLGQTLTIPTS
jgi:N-acetylmuramoyl-L-alanine amidase